MEFAGLCPGRVRSSVSTVASTIVSTPSFYLCFSFQQTFCNNSSIQSAFYTKFEPSPLFSAKTSNSASTAARTTVSCLYSAHARAPLQGPGGIGIARRLTLVGHLFLKQFLKLVFFHKKYDFYKKWLWNYHKIHSKSDLGLNFLDFEHTLFLNDSTTFLQYFHGSARSKQYQKHSKIKASKDTGFETYNFKKKYEIMQKITSKMSQKVVGYFGGGASGATFGGPTRFLRQNMQPKRSKSDPKVQKCSQSAPKIIPSAPKMTPRPQLKPQARRTARSALNPPPPACRGAGVLDPLSAKSVLILNPPPSPSGPAQSAGPPPLQVFDFLLLF